MERQAIDKGQKAQNRKCFNNNIDKDNSPSINYVKKETT